MKTNTYYERNNILACINYHFVFCPKYRRKIFLIPGVEARFKELTKGICKELQMDILEMECGWDHVRLSLRCGPMESPAEIMRMVKGASSHVLREEFPELKGMSSLWTRTFLVSTAEKIYEEDVYFFLDRQKTRG